MLRKFFHMHPKVFVFLLSNSASTHRYIVITTIEDVSYSIHLASDAVTERLPSHYWSSDATSLFRAFAHIVPIAH